MNEIIKKYSISAKKSLGQNFLLDENILESIAEITQVEWNNIIEVWPGYGVLTQKILSKNPLSLTLIELDQDMIQVLEKRIHHWEISPWNTQFEIIHTDVLNYVPDFSHYQVIANIPYYITSPIISHFLYDTPHSPDEMVLLVQKEVWERITSHKSSVLSLIVQKKCRVEKKIFVPRWVFFPPPKVDSLVIYCRKHHLYWDVWDQDFLTFIKKAFISPRKKLINNLMRAWFVQDDLLQWIEVLAKGSHLRPEDLSIENYIDLYNFLQKYWQTSKNTY